MTSLHSKFGIFPGHTDLLDKDVIINQRHIFELENHTEIQKKPVILLTSNAIKEEHIFINGLYQNIVLLYHLLTHIGYNVILVFDYITRDSASYHTELQNMSIIDADKIIEFVNVYNIKIHSVIEIGLHIPNSLRKILRDRGCKIIQLFLGNVLNIDIELSQSLLQNEMCHHVFGNVDEIWTSPHYRMNLEYIQTLYSCPIGKIAPYVWDSRFISSANYWSDGNCTGSRDIVIMEPNISIQKMFLLPLLICEAYFAKYGKQWSGNIHIYNTERFEYNLHICENVFPMLDTYNAKRIILHPRKTMKEIMELHSHAVFICNQLNNDLNYMVLELFIKGFPVLHNSLFWKNFGYYYSTDDISCTVNILHNAFINHSNHIEKYRHDANLLAWNYSIYNPKNINAWKELLDSRDNT
jgi:hypothetical protein